MNKQKDPQRNALQAALRAAATILLLAAAGTALAQSGDAPKGDVQKDNVRRGQYLAKAAGCVGCHTEEKKDAVPFAGGRALKTPFGTFYGPNITPDPQTGIGRWSEADFIRALRSGERPDGANYFPAFPYPSFTKMADGDMRDLFAYLRSLPPSARASQPHDLGFPFSWRFLVTFWKWFFFTPGPFVNIAGVAEAINRGAYLVQALGHCGECHTPRNFLGGPKNDRFLAGGMGPDGKKVPNLTAPGLKKRGEKDLKEFLNTGISPDGDVVAESMGEVIRNTTSQLTPADMDALIGYLLALAPIADPPK